MKVFFQRTQSVVSDWLLEYVLTVLKWYGIDPGHVKGDTSDSGSDCQRVFNVLRYMYHPQGGQIGLANV